MKKQIVEHLEALMPIISTSLSKKYLDRVDVWELAKHVQWLINEVSKGDKNGK